MHASEITHDRASDHNVMKVRDDKISVGDMHVDAQRGEKQAGKTAHGEKSEEAESVEHGRIVIDRTFVHRGCPVKDLDRGRHSNQITEQRENQGGVNRDSGDEHVVRPYQEAEDRDGDGRKGYEAVAENALAREAGDDLADDAH